MVFVIEAIRVLRESQIYLSLSLFLISEGQRGTLLYRSKIPFNSTLIVKEEKIVLQGPPKDKSESINSLENNLTCGGKKKSSGKMNFRRSPELIVSVSALNQNYFYELPNSCAS